MSGLFSVRGRPARVRATRLWTALVVLLAALGATLASPATAQEVAAASAIAPAPEYRISPGDELSVTFPYNAELNHDGPVGPDGRFTMPQIGNILLAHATLADATRTIADALRRGGIVEDARPSVTIRQYGASVYVGGEVRSPGLVRLTGGMDALQAVIVAGGLLDTAHSKKVVVIRRDAEGRPAQHYVDLRAYVRHNAAAGAEPLLAQDIVFVPKSSIAEADLWIDQYVNRLLPFSRSLNYSLGNTAVNTVTTR